jgi:hypothetical protein
MVTLERKTRAREMRARLQWARRMMGRSRWDQGKRFA